MIEQDFSDLRAVASSSAIGRWVAGMRDALAHAADDATTVQVVSGRMARFHGESPEARVRWTALTLAIGAASAWALSRIVPAYLGTFIPTSGFLVAVLIFSTAAAAPHVAVRQWERSLLQRLTRWLLD